MRQILIINYGMKQKMEGKTIFGEVNQSPIWAWDAPSGQPNSTGELVLNRNQVAFLFVISGKVDVTSGRSETQVSAGRVAVFSDERQSMTLRWEGDQNLLLVVMECRLIREMMESFRPGIDGPVRNILFGTSANTPPAVMPFPMVVVERLIPAFREPAVAGPARSFWFESQVKEMISLVCFRPSPGTEEFFCSRQKRLAMDRVSRVKELLRDQWDEPLDLPRLANSIGCSHYYLSRTFSTTTGMTISQYLRKMRIEKAAELLLSGRYNVSEAAVEVGYQSLSHFSKAFQEVKGCLPSKYEAA